MNTPASKLPFTLLNLAMTADGKIATANRKISFFSSRRDREHMMELRATVDAVMSGARTVDLNPVTLGPGAAKYRRLRKSRGLEEYNIRVIASGSGSIDPDAEIFRKRFSPIIILTTARAGKARLERLRTVAPQTTEGAASIVRRGRRIGRGVIPGRRGERASPYDLPKDYWRTRGSDNR
jgi:riboflavin biosynthesis pyrimidine reductase